jgi:hypothetical protein
MEDGFGCRVVIVISASRVCVCDVSVSSGEDDDNDAVDDSIVVVEDTDVDVAAFIVGSTVSVSVCSEVALIVGDDVGDELAFFLVPLLCLPCLPFLTCLFLPLEAEESFLGDFFGAFESLSASELKMLFFLSGVSLVSLFEASIRVMVFMYGCYGSLLFLDGIDRVLVRQNTESLGKRGI